MERKKLKGHLAMLGANMMWGLMSPVAKMVFAAGFVAPVVMVDFRVGGAALLFWLASLFLPQEHVPVKDILRLFGGGILVVLLFVLFFMNFLFCYVNRFFVSYYIFFFLINAL